MIHIIATSFQKQRYEFIRPLGAKAMKALFLAVVECLLTLPVSGQTVGDGDRRTYNVMIKKDVKAFFSKYLDHPEAAFRQYEAPESCKASFYFGIPDRNVLRVFNVSSTEIGFTVILNETEINTIKKDEKVSTLTLS
jgi:hypothetical protein